MPITKSPMNKPQKNNPIHNKGRAHISVTQQKFTHHSGPLPDPETLAQYNQISPGIAERIIAMAELEQKERHGIERLYYDNQHKQHARDTNSFRMGQICALLAVILVVALCMYCVFKGYPKQAATIGVAVIASVIIAFVGRKATKRNPQQNS